MSKEIIGNIHGIITQNRLTGAQYSFFIRQEHSERGGITITHNFSKTYLKEKYQTIIEHARKAGLQVTLSFEGKPNEYAQITHSIPMNAQKTQKILSEHKKQGNNVSGFKELVRLIQNS